MRRRSEECTAQVGEGFLSIAESQAGRKHQSQKQYQAGRVDFLILSKIPWEQKSIFDADVDIDKMRR
jgi:hypothetical protein